MQYCADFIKYQNELFRNSFNDLMKHLLIITLLSFSTSLFAQSVTVQDGYWNDPKTWQDGLVPGKKDDIIIRHQVVLEKSFKALGKIQVLENAILCVSGKIEIVEGKGHMHNQGTLRVAYIKFMQNFANHGLFEAKKVETVWKGFDTTKGKMRIGSTLNCDCKEVLEN